MTVKNDKERKKLASQYADNSSQYCHAGRDVIFTAFRMYQVVRSEVLLFGYYMLFKRK